jgi:hypothetical protein
VTALPPHGSGPVPRRVLLAGTFDVRNYGDLLFPVIARHELARHGIAVRPVSPSGVDTGWHDALPPEPVGQALADPAGYDGLLIGGGNIVHARPVTLPDYVARDLADTAYPSLWLDAALTASAAGKPVAWNAPGVPWPLHDTGRDDAVAAALRAARYLSVRDDESAGFLPVDGARVVPDTALGLAQVWPRATLRPLFDALAHRAPAGARFVVVHPKARSLDGPAEALAARLDAFHAQTGLVPVLVAIGQCHGDEAVTASIAARLACPHIDLSHPDGLRQIAAAIAFSAAYVGASMHGYVTAAAYGVPGTIVGRPRLPKIAGLLRWLDRPQDEQPDWAHALDAIAPRARGSVPLAPAVAPALRDHWAEVARHLHGVPSTRPRSP